MGALLPQTSSSHDSEADETRHLLETTAQLLNDALEMLRAAEKLIQDQAEIIQRHSRDLAHCQTRFFDRAPMAYIITDLRGIITSANLKAAALLGVPPSSLNGKLLTVYIAEEKRKAFDQELCRASTWLNDRDLRYPLLSQGSARPFCLTVSVERDQQRHPLRLLWLLRPDHS
jgi:PAS domain S-box-containing protein